MRLDKTLAIAPALALALTCFAACGSDDDSDSKSSEEQSTTNEAPGQDDEAGQDEAGQDEDAAQGGEGYSTKVTKCEFDETIQMVKVVAKITNESADTQSYIVHVDVLDASGQQVTQVHSTAGDVAAGETATTDGLAQMTGAGQKISCEVSDVTVS